MGVKNLSTQISWGLSSIHPSILAIFVNSSGLLKGMTFLLKRAWATIFTSRFSIIPIRFSMGFFFHTIFVFWMQHFLNLKKGLSRDHQYITSYQWERGRGFAKFWPAMAMYVPSFVIGVVITECTNSFSEERNLNLATR